MGSRTGVLQRNVHLGVCQQNFYFKSVQREDCWISVLLVFMEDPQKELLWVNKQRRLKAVLYGGHRLWGNKPGELSLGFCDAAPALQWKHISFTSHFRKFRLLSFWIVASGGSESMCLLWECPCEHTGEDGCAFLSVGGGVCVCLRWVCAPAVCAGVYRECTLRWMWIYPGLCLFFCRF